MQLKIKGKLLLGLIGIIIVVVGIVVVYDNFKLPPPTQSSELENYYLTIMKTLNAEENKTKIRNLFERDYNYTELLEWVNDTLVLDTTYTDIMRYWRIDPLVIIEIRRGQCGEFGILYVAACLAHDYDSRLVVATNFTDPNNWTDLHVWAEVKENGDWIHVDPAGVEYNKPDKYETWDWGKDIGSTVKIYAFEDGNCEEVTLSYLRNS